MTEIVKDSIAIYNEVIFLFYSHMKKCFSIVESGGIQN